MNSKFSTIIFLFEPWSAGRIFRSNRFGKYTGAAAGAGAVAASCFASFIFEMWIYNRRRPTLNRSRSHGNAFSLQKMMMMMCAKVRNSWYLKKMGQQSSKDNKITRTDSIKFPDRERFGKFGKRGKAHRLPMLYIVDTFYFLKIANAMFTNFFFLFRLRQKEGGATSNASLDRGQIITETHSSLQ